MNELIREYLEFNQHRQTLAVFLSGASSSALPTPKLPSLPSPLPHPSPSPAPLTPGTPHLFTHPTPYPTPY